MNLVGFFEVYKGIFTSKDATFRKGELIIISPQ